MDLLVGYGSDSSGSESSPLPEARQFAATVASQPTVSASAKSIARKPKKKGKRLLSLQAVLPPEIFDRLSRPEGEDSDSDADDGKEREMKRMMTGGDRSGVNSLLEELRSAPLQKGRSSSEKPSSAMTEKTPETSEGLGLAFMASTTVRTKNSGEVVDIHAPSAKHIDPEHMSQKQKGLDKSTAPPKKAIKFARMSAAAPVVGTIQQSTTEEMQRGNTYYDEPEVVTQQYATHANFIQQSHSKPINTHSSRKERREQERSLRSGAAFQSASTVEIHQPSPNEYAPTAHMAAIASRAAHLRHIGSIDPSDTSNYGEYGQQKAKAVGVAMYDPKTGTDVKGGVTGKHKSKHQINQLMVSAMGLEANRAGEAELARLGLGRGGGSSTGGRAQAKNKYGW